MRTAHLSRRTMTFAVCLVAALALTSSMALPAPLSIDNMDGTLTVRWAFGQPGDYISENVTLSPGSARLSSHELEWVQEDYASFANDSSFQNLLIRPGGGIELEMNETVQLLKNRGFAGPLDGSAYNWTSAEYGDGGVLSSQFNSGGMSDNGDCWVSWFWDFDNSMGFEHWAWVNQTVRVPSVPLAMEMYAHHNFTTTDSGVSPGSNAMLVMHSNFTGISHVMDQTGWVNSTYDAYRQLGSNSTAIFDSPGDYTFSLITYTDSSGDADTMTQIENFWDNASMLFTAHRDSGTYTSRVFNAGSQAMWGTISWEETLPPGTDIELYVRTGNSSVPTDSIWSGWSSALSDSAGSVIDRPWGQYLQYRAELHTSFTNVTPILDRVNITYDQYHLSGHLDTVDFMSPDLVRWGFFRHGEAMNGQTVRFSYSTDSGATWHDNPYENDIRSVPATSGKIRFRASLNTYDTAVTPEVQWMELDYVAVSPAFTLESIWGSHGTSPGEIARLSIHFNNTAPSRSATAWLNIYLDERMEYIANSSGALPTFREYLADSNPGIRRYVFADIPAGQNMIWLDARVRPGTSDGDMLQNTVTLEYLEPMEDRVESLLSNAPLRVNGPAISATLSALNFTADVGETIQYLLHVNNTGRGAAAKVWLNATHDDRVFMPNTTWAFDSIQPGSSMDIILPATLTHNVVHGSAIPMSISLDYSDISGRVSTVNAGPVMVNAMLRSRVQVQINTQVKNALSGDIILMTVHFNNTGSGTAESIRFLFDVPQGLEFVSSSEECIFSMNRCYWEIFGVGPGSHSLTVFLRTLRMPAWKFQTDLFQVTMQVTDPVDGMGQPQESNSISVSITRVYTFWERIYWPWSGIAAATGIALASWALWSVFKPVPPSIHDVFIIYRDGRLISHRKSREERGLELDGDLVGAMLTAVQQFVTDSLSTGKGDRVRKLEFGEMELFLERGSNINMALTYSGSMNRKLQRQAQELTARIEKEHPELNLWDGRMGHLQGVDQLIDGLVESWQRKN